MEGEIEDMRVFW